MTTVNIFFKLQMAAYRLCNKIKVVVVVAAAAVTDHDQKRR